MLTVYRASAGAGKTHKLTGEYLTLLFTGPGAFRRILAWTEQGDRRDEDTYCRRTVQLGFRKEIGLCGIAEVGLFIDGNPGSQTGGPNTDRYPARLFGVQHQYDRPLFPANYACLYTRDRFAGRLRDRNGSGTGAHDGNR